MTSGRFTRYSGCIIHTTTITITIAITITTTITTTTTITIITPHDQGKIKELELQVEQLQRAKEAKRPKTGTPPLSSPICLALS
jgi:hypothetical protein